MNTQAVQFVGEGSVRLGEVELREIGSGEVLLECCYSTVSPGTEMRCLNGTQVGHQGWPLIPGYSTSAKVLKVGVGVKLDVGTLVYSPGTIDASVSILWGGHVGHAVQKAASVIPIPEGVTPVNASFAHLAAIAWRGVVVSQVRPKEKVLVVGLGPIGQLSARLFKSVGADVKAIDLTPWRVQIAANAGIDAERADLASVQDWADIVVDATGVPSVLAKSLEYARPKPWGDTEITGAKVIVQGSYPDTVVVPYDPCFRKEISLIYPRDCQRSDIEAVIHLMETGQLHCDDLAKIMSPIDAPQAYAMLQDPSAEAITVSFDWSALHA